MAPFRNLQRNTKKIFYCLGAQYCCKPTLLTLLTHLAQMQALPLALSGNRASTLGVNTESMHQQRSSLVPAARAISMAQALGD